eukprot:5621689-Prymnesium_polylepis.1
MAAVLAEKRYYAPKCVAPKRVYRGSRLFDWRVLTAGLRAVCVECQCPASRFCGVGLAASMLMLPSRSTSAVAMKFSAHPLHRLAAATVRAVVTTRSGAKDFEILRAFASVDRIIKRCE